MFDWDNTLVDSWGVLHAAVNDLMRMTGRETWSLEEARQRMRRSMRDSFPAMFGDDWQRAADIYLTAYKRRHLKELRPMAGAGAMLETLAAAGIAMGVISNKSGYLLRREADHLGWSAYFACLLGAGDCKQDKPAADPVDMALKKMKLAQERHIWFVGDADVDMQMAHVTGLVPVLIHAEGRAGTGPKAPDMTVVQGTANGISGRGQGGERSIATTPGHGTRDGIEGAQVGAGEDVGAEFRKFPPARLFRDCADLAAAVSGIGP